MINREAGKLSKTTDVLLSISSYFHPAFTLCMRNPGAGVKVPAIHVLKKTKKGLKTASRRRKRIS